MDSSNELIMYFIVNKDLNMSAGKTAAQVAHTLTEYFHHMLENYGKNRYEINKYFNWHNTDQKKIVLKAKQSVLEKLENNYWSIRDNGLTEIEKDSLTCICLGVMTREEASPIVKRLQLL